MKRYLFLLLALAVCLPSIKAYNLPSLFNWNELYCQVLKQHKKGKPRSAFYVPQIFISEEFLSVQSECVNYDNVHVVITDSQSVIIKDVFILVEADAENLCYIGNLDKGKYEVTVEFEDFMMYSTFEI